MANNLLTISAITNQALAVLEDELKGHEEYKVVRGQGTKWAIKLFRWAQEIATIAEYPTLEEAEAVLKIINFSEGK